MTDQIAVVKNAGL